jgi:putative transposase
MTDHSRSGTIIFYESHPRQWVDRSSSAYTRRQVTHESHPRQWVDRSNPAYTGSRLVSLKHPKYPQPMHLEPLTDLSWAYQLHYYLCFRTHRRKGLFSTADRSHALAQELNEICERHGYHLLKAKDYPDHLRCLLSLRPADPISKTLQTVKTNLSRELGARFGLQAPMWADGFLARSIGRVRIDAVRKYLDSQSEHHGYAGRACPPVFRFAAKNPISLTAAHSVFDLNHHLVLATQHRRGVFDSRIGSELVEYWERVATKKGFTIDRATVLPDHVHLLVRIVPKISIENCVLALMNNGQHWFARQCPELLVKGAMTQLWQASAYAGTTGSVTTALVKSFLSHDP